MMDCETVTAWSVSAWSGLQRHRGFFWVWPPLLWDHHTRPPWLRALLRAVSSSPEWKVRERSGDATLSAGFHWGPLCASIQRGPVTRDMTDGGMKWLITFPPVPQLHLSPSWERCYWWLIVIDGPDRRSKWVWLLWWWCTALTVQEKTNNKMYTTAFIIIIIIIIII